MKELININIIIVRCVIICFFFLYYMTGTVESFIGRDDTVISSHYSVVPEHCHNNYITIKCFSGCRLPGRHFMAFEFDIEADYQRYVNKVLEVLRNQGTEDDIERATLNCSSKCESDPVYWSCIEDCESMDPTNEWSTTCFSNGIPCKTGDMSNPSCANCLYTSLSQRLEYTCEMAHFAFETPDLVNNLCNKLSSCNGSDVLLTSDEYKAKMIDLINVCIKSGNESLRMVSQCVNDKIMLNQRECCYSNKTLAARKVQGCGGDYDSNARNCDDVCMSVLSPHLCFEKCKDFRDDKVQKCKQDVDMNFNVSSELCSHCSTDYEVFDTEAKCVFQCTTSACATACLTSETNKYKGRHAKTNCRVPGYLEQFGKMKEVEDLIQEASGKTIDFRNSFWVGTNKVPMECDTTVPAPCDQQIKNPLNITILIEQCNKRPFRQLDFLACAISLKWTDLSLASITEKTLVNLSAILSACSAENNIKLKLYQLSYKLENETICGGVCKNNDTIFFHPTAKHNAISKVRCFSIGKKEGSPYCKPQIDPYIMELADFATCRWKLDFAKSDHHQTLWSHYFNELKPIEPKTKLEHPDNTKILPKTTYNDKPNFYAFPYFLILRAICDQGSYYGDDAYKFFMTGMAPKIVTKYTKPTNRHHPSTSVHASTDSALIKLKRQNDDDGTIPKNPQSIDDDAEERSCHEKICYPAFALPLYFLHKSNFKVILHAQQVFSKLSRTVYVSPYHARTVAGKGEIQIAAKDIPAHAAMLFPKERADFATDTELAYNHLCILGANATSTVEERESAMVCPELDHETDDFFHTSKTNIFFPLDAEDVFRTQYTYGTAPVQPIAGFYDPRLMVIGDADMNNPEVVNWGRLLKNLEGARSQENVKDREARESRHSCIQTSFKHRGFEKPLYSHLDTSDPSYPINYYRLRYAPLKYTTTPGSQVKDWADTGIFHAIGLEDRLLLVTNKGLVSFYGHSNATVWRDKAWKYDEDILNRCFKIVRILPNAQPNVDLIIGITYDYKYKEYKTEQMKDVRQEIWIGNFTHAGEKIKWVELKSNPMDTVYLEERLVDQDKPRGALLPVSHLKNPKKHPGNQEANPTSQVESICFKAFRSEIKKFSVNVRLSDTTGWCEAIDATPVQRKENVIQVLVRMRVHYLTQTLPMYFYVVASHLFHSTGLDTVWTIDSIIPRFPCVNDHREAIRNVFTVDKNYFSESTEAETFVVCHDASTNPLDNRIYLSGMSYTKSYSANLFLYGSRLLQSSNYGKNFIFLRSFPRRLENFQDFLESPDNNYIHYQQTHRIVRIAFDEAGHYAFLTNKRELWLGSTSSIHQYLLRPSPLQSMLQLSLSMVKNVNDGIPFTVDFDSQKGLYELVAVLDEWGDISRIMKRPVNEWNMLGAKSLLDSLKVRSENLVSLRIEKEVKLDEIKKPFNYNIARWSPYCAFVSPILTQNFSELNDRMQYMFMPHPDQHLSLGKAYIEESLMAFQVSTFSLIWRTFFRPYKQSYAGYFKDPFQLWIDVKQHEETIAKLQYYQGERPQDHGILVSPSEHKRLQTAQVEEFDSGILDEYWLDFLLTIELRLHFSIKNDYSVANKDYEADEIDNIQLDVENANGSVIQINTEKTEFPHNSSIVYIIHMALKNKTGLKQNFPGENLLDVPVTYHLVGAFGQCIYNKATGVIGDYISTNVKVGCPASRDFVFDWNSTLRSIYLKGDRVKTGDDKVPHGTGSRCYQNKFACFYAKVPVIMHFSVFDEAKQALYPYTGKYVMRIVGGGREQENIQRYTDEEIEAFNFPGVSDVSLVWKEWDPEGHKKIEKKLQVLKDRQGNVINRDDREIVMESGKTSIVWACHTLSPCARINPAQYDVQVVYWFRILVSNRDVDQETLCLFEKEFDIMLYGFRPAPEFQFLTTIGSCVLLMSILYITFLCCRRNARVWRHTKSNVKNWYYITKDAIPKKLRMFEPPLADEDDKGKKSKKKHKHKGGSDENLSPGLSGSSLESDLQDLSTSHNRIHSSESTVESTSTVSNILPEATMKKGWKEAKYDLILSKRLNTIVERNWAIRRNLLKKASLQQGGRDLEIEEFFEKQFGRTASEESLFTPPLPKDKRGGIDSFL